MNSLLGGFGHRSAQWIEDAYEKKVRWWWLLDVGLTILGSVTAVVVVVPIMVPVAVDLLFKLLGG